MTVTLSPGANAPLDANHIQLNLYLPPAEIAGAHVDVAAFLLSADGKVRDGHDRIFEGQPSASQDAVTFNGIQNGAVSFAVHFDRVDNAIEKIVFVATIHENERHFAAFKQVQIVIHDSATNVTLIQAPISTESMLETALILGECYRRQGKWKFRVVAQGFLGGLKPLLKHFGLPETSTASVPSTSSAPSSAPSTASASLPPAAPSSSSSIPPANPSKTSSELAPSPSQPQTSSASIHSLKKPLGVAPTSSAASPRPTVSLSKVSLDKSRSSISLEKRTSGFGEIRINLNWSRGHKNGLLSALFGGRSVDLDLGCLYELVNGQKGVIQALGKSFGQLHQPPFIQLMGDDRTGDTQQGEWLHINGAHWPDIKRILVFAYIYEGVPNWATTDALITLHVPGEPDVEVRLIEGSKNLGMCAVASLENVNGTIRVSREMRYVEDHEKLDQTYGWGLRWKAGAK